MTWYQSKAARRVHHVNKWILLIVLIAVAVISLSGRVLLGHIEYFKSDIEQLLAGYGIKGVSLDNIHGDWRGLHPLIKVQGASLSIPGHTQSISINELELSLKLISSVLSGQIQLISFHSNIEKIILVRDVDGAWRLNGIPLNSNENESESGVDIATLYQSLPDNISVNIGLLQIQDKVRGVDHLIQNSSLLSRRKWDRLKIDFISQLPSSLGNKVSILLLGDYEKQQAYIEADQVNVVQWANLILQKPVPVHSAKMNIKGWIDLDKFSPTQVVTQTDFSQIKSQYKAETQQPLSFSLLQKAQYNQGDWRYDLRLSPLTLGSQKLPGFHSQLLLKKDAEPQVWVDALSVSTLTEIAANTLDDETAQLYLNKIQPTALLRNLVASINVQQPIDSSVRFDFLQLKTNAYNFIPGVKGFSGNVITSSSRGKINLNSKNAAVDFGKLFRDPIQLSQLDTEILLDLTNGAGVVYADSFALHNDDLKMQGRFWLEVPQEGAPFMALRADYKEGNAQSTHKYLPVSIMKESLVKWLDDSIQDGYVEKGDLIYHGRLEPLPNLQNNQSGEFEALFDLSNPKVKFLADWPEVTEGQLTASFHNMGMDIEASGSKFSTTRFNKVNVSIPDFLNSTLFINGHTNTTAKSVIDTLSDMPILNVFDQVKSKTKKLSGSVNAQLDITIPLNDHNKPPNIQAEADLIGVSVSIPDWMVDFKSVTGPLSVDNERISAPLLKGLYYGDPALLKVKPDIKRKRTQLDLSGKLHTKNLMQLLPLSLKDPVSGRSDWKVGVSIDHHSSANKPFLEISAVSNLKGTAQSYPLPFEVLKDQQSPLKFKGELSDKQVFDFNVQLKDRFVVKGIVDLSPRVQNRLSALEVNFGLDRDTRKKSSVKPVSGIRVYGTVKSANVNDWFDYYDQYFSGIDDESNNVLEQISRVSLNFDTLSLFNQTASDLKFTAYNNQQHIFGDINSALIKGAYELPYRMDSAHPLVAKLDYLKLKKSASKDKGEKITTPIHKMPNLDIRSLFLSFEEMDFNQLVLRTRTEKDQFNIDQFDFSRDQIQFKSSGFWHEDTTNSEDVSVFNIGVTGKDFGKTIDELGLGKTLRDGEIDFNGQIGWGAELYNLTWPTLIGEVHLSLEDGYLKNVDPGAGRFVGLLSFNALPRRLFLDFGDVVREGTQFSKIEGSFNIRQEIMETKNASMDGPSAKVNIIGNTNLRTKTYDQTMIIQPKVGDTLPIIGGLAAGSAVGWGLLLLNKIFNNPIDKSVEIEYKVTGDWDDPQVTLISKPPPEKEREDGDNIFDFQGQ